MQVPFLTDSHQSLIRTVCSRHRRVVIFLGTTGKLIDEKNPFPFEFRKQMIESTDYSGSIFDGSLPVIVPLPDMEDNDEWVKNLDMLVNAFLSKEEDAILYGGRSSFIEYYNGKYKTSELAPNDYDSGTQLRELASIDLPRYSPEAASAILWTLRQRYSIHS